MIRRLALALAISSLLLTHAFAADDEFRCDSEIFMGEEKKPVQETITIFTGKLAYDFLLTAPEEITVYDFGRGQFTLIDKNRKVKTTIASDDLLRFTAAYKTIKPDTELFSFCTQPSFDEEFSEKKLRLHSKTLTYQVECIKPEHTGADKRYRDFADWSARLNAMRPGNLPPFPRMEMNKSLAARNMLPSKIERTISTFHLTGTRTEVVRSHHLFNWQLSLSDRRRIDQVGDYLTQFEAVSPEVYLKVGETGSKTASR
jgi:hypothetical protein